MGEIWGTYCLHHSCNNRIALQQPATSAHSNMNTFLIEQYTIARPITDRFICPCSSSQFFFYAILFIVPNKYIWIWSCNFTCVSLYKSAHMYAYVSVCLGNILSQFSYYHCIHCTLVHFMLFYHYKHFSQMIFNANAWLSLANALKLILKPQELLW